MPRPTTVRIEHGDFVHEETFISKLDADHWRRMMEETLLISLATALELHLLAAGLAGTVRRLGGPHAWDQWLSGEPRPGSVVPKPGGVGAA